MSDDVLSGLNLDGLGLEIGAGYNPLAPADANVRYLDHEDREALIEKYRPHAVDVSKIRHVDYVWKGERYADLIGEARFDWIIASHVIEHMPCLVTFLNECAEILKPEGVLSLVIPDKRFCFDHYRPVSGLAHVLDTYLAGARMPTPGALAEMVINASAMNGAITWSQSSAGAPQFLHTAAQARGMYEAARSGYCDTHVWVFTPNSLRLLVSDLQVLGFCSLQEHRFETSGGQFYLQLSARGAGGPDRLSLARAALADGATPIA